MLMVPGARSLLERHYFQPDTPGTRTCADAAAEGKSGTLAHGVGVGFAAGSDALCDEMG